jgi:hypothetical protein
MQDMVVWNIILTGIVGVIGFFAKAKFDELDRIAILLNKTREEVARDSITRKEVNDMLDKFCSRIENAVSHLEGEIDKLRKDT